MVISPTQLPICHPTPTPTTTREEQPRTFQVAAIRPPPATQTTTNSPVATPSLPSSLSPVFQLTSPGPVN